MTGAFLTSEDLPLVARMAASERQLLRAPFQPLIRRYDSVARPKQLLTDPRKSHGNLEPVMVISKSCLERLPSRVVESVAYESRGPPQRLFTYFYLEFLAQRTVYDWFQYRVPVIELGAGAGFGPVNVRFRSKAERCDGRQRRAECASGVTQRVSAGS